MLGLFSSGLWKSARRWGALILTLGVIGGCGGGGGDNPGPYRAIEIDPQSAQLAAGTQLSFKVTALHKNGSREDVTDKVTWEKFSTPVARLDAGSAVVTGLAPGDASFRANYTYAVPGSTTTFVYFEYFHVRVTAATPTSVKIVPGSASIAAGTQTRFKVEATFTDRSVQDVTPAMAWTSSDTYVASVDATGLARGEHAGRSTITARCQQASACGGLSATATLEVSAAVLSAIALTPANPSAAKGTTQQFVATGTFSDNSQQDLSEQVTWASSDVAVASISNASGKQGLASALAQGSARITASKGSVSAPAQILTVTPAALASIQVGTGNSSIGIGQQAQFTAVATYTDNSVQDVTTQASWGSSNAAVATISNADGNQGKAQAKDQYGPTDIRASMGGIDSDPAVLTVGPARFTTAGAASWTAPADMQVEIAAVGAGGGGSGAYSGGHGGVVTSNVPVTQGQVLDLFVGGGGSVDGGPFNDGGGGGGGGASSVDAATGNQVIAGGGGGAGGFGQGGDGTGQAGSGPQPGQGGANGSGGAAGSAGADSDQPGGNGSGGAGGDSTFRAPGGSGLDTGDGRGGNAAPSGASPGGGGGGGHGGGGAGGRSSGGGGGGSTGPNASISVGSNGGPALAAGGSGSITISRTP